MSARNNPGAPDAFFYDARLSYPGDVIEGSPDAPCLYDDTQAYTILPETRGWEVGVSSFYADAPSNMSLWTPAIATTQTSGAGVTDTTHTYTLSLVKNTISGVLSNTATLVAQSVPILVTFTEEDSFQSYSEMCILVNRAISTAWIDSAKVPDLISGQSLGPAVSPPYLSYSNYTGRFAWNIPVEYSGVMSFNGGYNWLLITPNEDALSMLPFPIQIQTVSLATEAISFVAFTNGVYVNPVENIPQQGVLFTATGGGSSVGVLPSAVYANGVIQVVQEYTSTSKWSNIISLMITTSSIPIVPTILGQCYTTVSANNASLPIGTLKMAVLFDKNWDDSNEIVFDQGVSIVPDVVRYYALNGGPLSTIRLQAWLRTYSDFSPVPWVLEAGENMRVLLHFRRTA
jgi:hypothetical protein